MKTYQTILPLLLIALLAGCSSGVDSLDVNEENTVSLWNSFLQQEPSLPNTIPPVEMELILPEREAQSGDSLQFSFEVRNTSEDSLFMLVDSGFDHFDFVVLDADSAVVWNRLPDIRNLSQAGSLFEPGQTRTFNHTWNLKDESGDPVPEGTYRVFAGFLGAEYTDTTFTEVFEGPAATGMEEIVIK